MTLPQKPEPDGTELVVINTKVTVIPASQVEREVGAYQIDERYIGKLLEAVEPVKETLAAWAEQIAIISSEIKRVEKLMDARLAPIKVAKKAIEEAQRAQKALYEPYLKYLADLKEMLSGPHGRATIKIQEEELKRRQLEATSSNNQFLADTVAVPKPMNVKTGGATVFVRQLDRLRVTDITKVPQKYLLVNESLALDDYRKAGKGSFSIPGIDFYQESSTSVRENKPFSR